MLSRICCLLLSPKSPKLVFLALLTTGIFATICFLYFADFHQLLHGSVFRPAFEHRAAFERNVPRFRVSNICPLEVPITSTIFVISSPENAVRRQIIRNTWGHPQVTNPLGLGVVFLVGETKDATAGRLVDWEAEVYGDIVRLTFPDSHGALLLKILAGLKWVLEFCSPSQYVIKVDDDLFINVYALKRFLSDRWGEQQFLMCLVWDNTKSTDTRETTEASMTVDDFDSTTYPTYCSGYIMSIDVARSLQEASLTTPIFSHEGAFVTGILAKQAGVPHSQIGYTYSFNSRDIRDLTEGRILFAHLEAEKTTLGSKMWEEIFTYENNKTYHTSDEESIVIEDIPGMFKTFFA